MANADGCVLGAKNGNMMNSGWWGGGWMGSYGGIWTPILLIGVVVLVVLVSGASEGVATPRA